MPKGGQEEKEYYLRIYHHLSPTQRTILTQHAADIKSHTEERNSLGSRIEANQSFHLVSSSIGMIFRILLMICSNPFLCFTRPLDAMYVIMWFGTVYSCLFFLNGLFLSARFWGVGKILSYLGGRYGGGFSVINWADITLFDSKKHIFDSATPALGSDVHEQVLTVEDHPDILHALSSRPLQFNVDIARSILLMCAIIYERDTKCVQKAAEGSMSNTSPDDSVLLLIKSEERMLQLADEWGLGFVSVADFRNLTGLFAGCYFSYQNNTKAENPYIVLVIKGTSPNDFKEWILDCECKLESAGDFLATGMAHEGFYTSSFPCKGHRQQVLPYFRMIQYVKMIAHTAFLETGKKSNLFIGGHSLGAGIASLLYARLLESPGDLGDHIVLRDAYTFGTPRTCDAKLASRVDFNLNKPINVGRQMWRVCNRSRSPNIGDVVTRVPPGLATCREIRSALPDGSYLSYATIGVRVDLKPFQTSPFYSILDIPAGYSVDVYKSQAPENEFGCHQAMSQDVFPQDIVQSIIKLVERFFPILHDHFPASYMHALDKMQTKIG